jgi:hypothetical protein
MKAPIVFWHRSTDEPSTVCPNWSGKTEILLRGWRRDLAGRDPKNRNGEEEARILTSFARLLVFIAGSALRAYNSSGNST